MTPSIMSSIKLIPSYPSLDITSCPFCSSCLLKLQPNTDLINLCCNFTKTHALVWYFKKSSLYQEELQLETLCRETLQLENLSSISTIYSLNKTLITIYYPTTLNLTLDSTSFIDYSSLSNNHKKLQTLMTFL